MVPDSKPSGKSSALKYALFKIKAIMGMVCPLLPAFVMF